MTGSPEKQSQLPHPARLLISNTRKPVSYVNLAKRLLQEHGEVCISALGIAVSPAVTVAEILKSRQLATEKAIHTSLESIGELPRSRQKPKIDIILIKAPAFDEIVAAESQLQSSTNEHTASAVSSAAIAQSSNVAADEQIGFSAQHYEASEIALSMSSPLAHTAVQGSPLADGSTEEGPGQSERQLKQ